MGNEIASSRAFARYLSCSGTLVTYHSARHMVTLTTRPDNNISAKYALGTKMGM